MARPQKQGMEYFPLDCQMDDKIDMLKAVHGPEGFAAYIMLLQEIYQAPDGELDMTIVFRWKTLGKKFGIPEENLRNIIGDMLEIGLFDKMYYETTQKLTSNGIKKRINDVTERRQKDRKRKSGADPEFSSGKPLEKYTKGKDISIDISKKGKNSSVAIATGEVSLTHKLRLAVEELVPTYYWTGKDGKAAMELAEKLKHSYRATRKAEPTDEQVVDSLKTLIGKSKSLQPYLHFTNVATLNEKYNGIVTEVHSQLKPPSAAKQMVV